VTLLFLAMLITAVFYPSVCMSVMMMLNFVATLYGSSQFLGFASIVLLFSLCCCFCLCFVSKRFESIHIVLSRSSILQIFCYYLFALSLGFDRRNLAVRVVSLGVAGHHCWSQHGGGWRLPLPRQRLDETHPRRKVVMFSWCIYGSVCGVCGVVCVCCVWWYKRRGM